MDISTSGTTSACVGLWIAPLWAMVFVSLTLSCTEDDGRADLPTTQHGEYANVVVSGSYAYFTAHEQGIVIYNVTTGEPVTGISPPTSASSCDDVAIADGLLFVLDASDVGSLSVYSLTPNYDVSDDSPGSIFVDEWPLVASPVEVAVGPFSGVSAKDGVVVVSGGTSELTVFTYSPEGTLSAPVATADLGSGQPDVLVTSKDRAYVSTHFHGETYGITALSLPDATTLESITISGSGFTEGGAAPGNFPIESAALDDDTVLVAVGAGLAVIRNNTLERVIDLPVAAVNVDTLDGSVAVVGSDPAPTLVLLDSSLALERVVPLPANAYPTGVALTADRVVIAAHGAGSVFIDR